MSITGGEQLTEQVIMSSSKAGMEVTGKVAQLTAAGLKLLMRLSAAGLKKLPTTAGRREHGKMTIKNLQRRAGGDLHAQQVSTELLRSVQHDLKRRGVDFSVEKGADALYYVHFKGADVDTVRHALTQAEAKIKPDAQTQQATPGNRNQKEAPELPAGDLLVDHGRAPYEHEEGASPSYFVTTENALGETKTVWGVDLERAIEQAGATPGDRIELEQLGSVPVTLPGGVQTHRNEWRVAVKSSEANTRATPSVETGRIERIGAAEAGHVAAPHGTTILAAIGAQDKKQSLKPQSQADVMTTIKAKAFSKASVPKPDAPKPSRTRSQSR